MLTMKGREDMENKIKIVVGTSNPHKIKEMNEIAKDYNVEFLLPDCKNFNPDESGETFGENAEIKAKEASKVSSGELFLADDSGLCVDFLKGAPGIHSARYDTTPLKRTNKLLGEMNNTDNREAYFVCALCLVDSSGKIVHKEEGRVYGEIAHAPYGKGGFGYDPIFIVKGLNKTMAELSDDEKNKISHRGQALKNMLEWLKKGK